MARKYRRSGNGRFAGGGGGSTSAGGGGRKIAKNGSKGVKAAKPKLTAGQRFKKGAKATGKFVVKHPRAVIGVVGLGMSVHSMHGTSKALKAGETRARIKTDFISSKRGIGSTRPGAGLKMAKRGRITRAHKIRS